MVDPVFERIVEAQFRHTAPGADLLGDFDSYPVAREEDLWWRVRTTTPGHPRGFHGFHGLLGLLIRQCQTLFMPQRSENCRKAVERGFSGVGKY